MLKSMTGFGRAENTRGETTIVVEVKSLNGKQFEVNLKISPLLKPYEFDIRNKLQQTLLRGTLDATVNIRQNGATRPVVINTDLAKYYHQSITTLATELNLPQEDMLNVLMKLPEVVTPATEQITEDDWQEVEKVITLAVADLDAHRLDEGQMLAADLLLRIENIESYTVKVRELDPQRKDRVRQRLEGLLAEYVGKENVDENRLEQELIFYLEKLDISEELVRLENHCRYFKEILAEQDPSKGKKLGFVLQEVGREINTTGSKANDASIQQWVVLMKDELEKAKEQVLNVL
ncbi:MAG TPA: YicC/YloC family endoribonuclease [Chitinophaga sp.]|uniref:YicC family protein n=1 Tax=Chitinophaga tropicalis TaxID=2683588 RepID=A0A7K1TY83_9BACT|nr:YicC/YloC family endoribonuclease [Chitinophaga tropicalis]MVT07067.1 YicC family protein [Chitinophaga tropicalis]HJT73729.1 YicC/YloC family endoribonuclease [Chitinophaga sp.]